jgi:DNA-binding GntR family transcriptional regulator/transposase-like protein
MADGAHRLSREDRAELLRITRSRQVSHGQGVRARVVLDCAEMGVTEAARRASVSTTSVSRWWRTYRHGGVDALLAVTPPQGRPTVTDDMLRAVLGCSLTAPPDGRDRWTTRAVAEVTGVSQATVSRIRRQHFPPVTGLDVGEKTLILSYVDIGPRGCTLGFERETGESTGAEPSAVLTDAVETVLCAALLRRSRADDAGTTPDGDAFALLRRAEREWLPEAPVTLVVDQPLDSSARRWLTRHPTVTVLVRPGPEWPAQLHHLAARIAPTQLRELRALQLRIRDAAATASGEEPWTFTWSRGLPRATPPPEPVPAAPASVQDISDTVAAMCSAIADGGVRPGEAISVRLISGLSGLSRPRTSEVLNYLADQAILDRRAGHLWLPAPTPRDVIETYTARGLLGTALVRTMALQRISPPAYVDTTLARISVCAEHRLDAETYALDMDLQDQLALAAGMPRISWMFVQLTAQVRLFISILGLDYRYPTAEIIADDQRIIDEIRSQDPARAVEAWRTKVDNCVRYMLGQLNVDDRRN